MKKGKILFKLVAMVMAIAMTMVLFVGCERNNTGPTANNTTSTSATDSKPTENKKLKAAMITPQKLGDGGPIDLCYSGLTQGAEEFEYDIKVLEPEEGEYEDSIRAMADDGYDLIVCVFSALQDALTRVAPEYPDTKFVMILGEVDSDNVKNMFYKEQEASFLCGVAAAMTSKTGKIAAIRGADVGDNIRFTAGFFDGAKAVNPDIKCIPLLAGSFEDPTKGKELANLAMDQDCDIIMQICAKTSIGIREAIAERGLPYQMVGIVFDEVNSVPGQVLCSSLTSYGVWIYNAMKELAGGTFKGGTYWEGLSNNATDIAYTDNITDEVKAACEKYRAKIISGEIVPAEKF